MSSKVENKLRALEKRVKELERIESEQNKFLKGWSDYFEKRDKRDEERDQAIRDLCEILGDLKKIGKSKTLSKFLKETNKRQERGREAQKRYID